MANEVCFRNLDLDRPWLLEQYQRRGGYEVLARVLREQTPPAQIIDEVISPACAGVAGPGSPPDSSGASSTATHRETNTSSATPTRASPGRSRTERSCDGLRTVSSRAA